MISVFFYFVYLHIAQFGSVRDLGSRGRRFKSCYVDHYACMTELE